MDLVGNEFYIEENEPISTSMDELSTDYDSDLGYISTNAIKYIQDGNYNHPVINARDARFKINGLIRQAKSEQKGAELSVKTMGNFYITSLIML